MLVGDLHEELKKYVENEDLSGANDLLMEELGGIVADNKKDFITLLNKHGIEADKSMPSAQLIEAFIDNVDNKELLIGASFLINSENDKSSSFSDGESFNDNVILSYAVMHENFNGDEEEEATEEDFSYIAPFFAGLIQKGANALRNFRQNNGGQNNAMAQAQARMQMEAMRRQQIARQRQEARRRRRTTNIILISTGGVLLAGLTAFLIYKNRKK